MKEADFKDYQMPAKYLEYNKVPFAKVVHLKFTQVWSVVQYRLSWEEDVLKTVNVWKLAASTRKVTYDNHVSCYAQPHSEHVNELGTGMSIL